MRAVAEVCKLRGGTGTHRRAGLDFGIVPVLVSDGEHEGVETVSEGNLEAIVGDDLLICKLVTPEELQEPEEEPQPEWAKLAIEYEELYGQKPHPKMLLETLVDRIERKRNDG